MFIKRTKALNMTYIQIVKSFREGKKVRHELILNLGRIDKIKKNDVESLINVLLELKEELFGVEEKNNEE